MERLPSSESDYSSNNELVSIPSLSSLPSVLISYLKKFLAWYKQLSPIKKIMFSCFIIFEAVFDILLLIYYQDIIEYLANLSGKWHDSGLKGSLLMFLLICGVSFPPLIGFLPLCTMSGMIYGLSGFKLIAPASIIGSTASFTIFKYLLTDYSVKLIEGNKNLELFVGVLNDDSETFLQGLLFLILIKLSPLPYSFTNGALGCIPGIPVFKFFLACLISSPKLFVQLFVGSQLKKIGDVDRNGIDKWLDFLSIGIAVLSFTLVTYILYKRMLRKVELMNANNGISLEDEMNLIRDDLIQ